MQEESTKSVKVWLPVDNPFSKLCPEGHEGKPKNI